jgi:Bacterial regulatory protein, Fis family/Sigma-54 interaction domain
MQSRRSRGRPLPRVASGLTLLEIGPVETRPLRLYPAHPLVLGNGDDGQVRLVPVEGGTVEVRVAGGAAVRVNDVQVRNVGHARAGDLISLPDRSVLVQRFSPRAVVVKTLWSHESFEQRLAEEVNSVDPTRGSVSILVVRSRALIGEGLAEFLAAPELNAQRDRDRAVIIGRAAPATLELLFPGASAVEAHEFREQLSEALGRLGRPFRWGWACAPADGLHPATLWGRALDRLFGDQVEQAEELPHVDPVMVRLWSLCDVWSEMRGGVLLQGEVGSGRETLARVIHERGTPQSPFVVVRSASFDNSVWRASVDRASGGSLYVRHLERLPPADHASFWQATAFRPMAGAQADELTVPPPIVVSIPALRDRPLDILPIAEHVAVRYSAFDGRKLKLTPTARSALSQEWTGSVRELKSSLQLAALLVDESGEVLPEHLASFLSQVSDVRAGESDVRVSLRNIERRTFLEALGKTNWNVTNAARALGLPRRTVVYRMSRLGLKRPSPAT